MVPVSPLITIGFAPPTEIALPPMAVVPFASVTPIVPAPTVLTLPAPSSTVRPSVSSVLSPAVTLSTSRSRLSAISTTPSSSAPVCVTARLASPWYVTVPFGPMFAVLPSASVTFQPAVANPCTAVNCATFTASVGAAPAATPVIWRVALVPLPTLTAPSVLRQVGVEAVEAVPVAGS